MLSWFAPAPASSSSSSAGTSAVPVIILCGLDGAGKTCLSRFLTFPSKPLTEHAPTLRNRVDTITFSSSSSSHHHHHHQSICVKLVDCSGDAEFGRRWELALGSGIVFVVDGADRARLPEARQELDRVRRRVRQRMRIAVALNKSDLVTFCPVNDLLRELGVEASTGEEDDESNNVRVFECSVYQNTGLTQALDWVVYK